MLVSLVIIALRISFVKKDGRENFTIFNSLKKNLTNGLCVIEFLNIKANNVSHHTRWNRRFLMKKELRHCLKSNANMQEDGYTVWPASLAGCGKSSLKDIKEMPGELEEKIIYRKMIRGSFTSQIKENTRLRLWQRWRFPEWYAPNIYPFSLMWRILATSCYNGLS